MISTALAAEAHHSIAGVYDSTRPVALQGTVVEFEFVNPHPVLTVNAADDGQPAALWRLEMDNRFELSEIGISATTFKPGDRVIANGSAHRNEAQRLYLRRLERPADGLIYEQVGFRPRVNLTPGN